MGNIIYRIPLRSNCYRFCKPTEISRGCKKDTFSKCDCGKINCSQSVIRNRNPLKRYKFYTFIKAYPSSLARIQGVDVWFKDDSGIYRAFIPIPDFKKLLSVRYFKSFDHFNKSVQAIAWLGGNNYTVDCSDQCNSKFIYVRDPDTQFVKEILPQHEVLI